MKQRIKTYLSISKKEWNGLVVLVVLIALVLAAPYVYQLFHKDNIINFKEFDKQAALISKANNDTSATSSSNLQITNPVMFSFNPNHLPVEQWRKLGLSEHQANVIKHYEAKGGRFYRREDVKKIYAITPAEYKRLEPYIDIPDRETQSNKVKPGTVIEINTADSAKLTSLRGVGPAFAMRIIRYRGRLGGFFQKEQLKEIPGIDSSKYAEIEIQVRVNPVLVMRININTVSFIQLRQFPYLSYKQVNAIIQYRNQHGKYSSLADMKNIAILDDGILRKIEPYLVFK
ncbi:hypothetical protein BH09BAC6_BH09BAC6_14630 [soil metagenome]|jgi:competence protein ComEA